MKISSALLSLLLTSTARAFVVSSSSSSPRTANTKLAAEKKMFDTVEEAIKEAEKLCEEGNKEECAMMWDIVEELEAADSHAKGLAPGKEVSKKTQYELELAGFALLEKEVQGQMDQLKALTSKMADLGVKDESLAKLGSLSNDMKLTLAQAKLGLPKKL